MGQGKRIGRALPSDMISYGRQSISEQDIAAVGEVLRSDFMTCGPKVEEEDDWRLAELKHRLRQGN